MDRDKNSAMILGSSFKDPMIGICYIRSDTSPSPGKMSKSWYSDFCNFDDSGLGPDDRIKAIKERFSLTALFYCSIHSRWISYPHLMSDSTN